MDCVGGLALAALKRKACWISAVLGLVPHTPGTPLHPGAPSGNGPTPNFWTPSWASCSPTIQPLLFVSHLFSSAFSHCPLVPMSQYKPLPIRLTHACSPQMDAWPFRCTSPPITTHMTPSYNSKRDSPLHPCVLDSFTMSHFFSLMDNVSHLYLHL